MAPNTQVARRDSDSTRHDSDKERQEEREQLRAERERSNNPATADQRQYSQDDPGMHPANMPSDRVSGEPVWKGTRLDLEDVTGNPGHRGVNPDAPAGSINYAPNHPNQRQNELRGGKAPIQSINEPPHVEPPPRLEQLERGSPNEPPGSDVFRGIDGDGENTKIQQRLAGPGGTQGPQGRLGAQQQGTTPLQGQGSAASINEPAGSTIGSNMPAGEADIESLDPEEADVGDPDLTMHVHGSGFTQESVIVFNGGDEPTTFVSASELTTGVKPSLVSAPSVVPVLVRTGSQQTDALEFEFLPADEPASRGAPKHRQRTKSKAKGRR